MGTRVQSQTSVVFDRRLYAFTKLDCSDLVTPIQRSGVGIEKKRLLRRFSTNHLKIRKGKGREILH